VAARRLSRYRELVMLVMPVLPVVNACSNACSPCFARMSSTAGSARRPRRHCGLVMLVMPVIGVVNMLVMPVKQRQIEEGAAIAAPPLLLGGCVRAWERREKGEKAGGV